MCRGSHINLLSGWFSEKINFRPKQIYIRQLHEACLPTWNRKQWKRGAGGTVDRVPRESDLYTPSPSPSSRICSVSRGPFQIKWLFRGSYPGELPCDGSLHFEHREKLVVGFYKFWTKEYWPVFVLAFNLSPGRWDSRPLQTLAWI